MTDALQALLILFAGCLLLAGVEMIGQAIDRKRRMAWRRVTRRSNHVR